MEIDSQSPEELEHIRARSPHHFPLAQFCLAANLARLGRLEEARSAVQAGLALDPAFTIRRFRANAQSDNPTYLAQRERICEDMRKAGVPEG